MEFLRARKKAGLTIAFIAMACLAIFLAIHVVNGPVSATHITASAPPATRTVQAPSLPQLITVSNPYASFSYPNSMRPVANIQGSEGPVLAAYNYLKSDILTWELSITVNKLQSPNLESDSGYLMRKENPAEYQENTVTYGDNTFIIMNDTGANGFGELVFLLHGSMDANIHLVGDDASGTSGLDTTFQQVLQSWKWQ